MKYKDHRDLGISFAEFGALLGTRALLAAKIVRHTDDRNVGPHKFDMATGCRSWECSSVSCIGGTMGLIMFDGNTFKANDFVYEQCAKCGTDPTVWSELFFPGSVSMRRKYVSPNNEWHYERITPNESIKAIDAFLSGKPRKSIWPKSTLKKMSKPE